MRDTRKKMERDKSPERASDTSLLPKSIDEDGLEKIIYKRLNESVYDWQDRLEPAEREEIAKAARLVSLHLDCLVDKIITTPSVLAAVEKKRNLRKILQGTLKQMQVHGYDDCGIAVVHSTLNEGVPVLNVQLFANKKFAKQYIAKKIAKSDEEWAYFSPTRLRNSWGSQYFEMHGVD